MRYTEVISCGDDSNPFAYADKLPRKENTPRRMRREPDDTSSPDKKPDSRFRSLPTPTPFFEPVQTTQLQKDYPEFSDLIELFVVHNGIESTHMMLRGEMGARVDNKNTLLTQNGEALIVATGHIFERLAYYFLREHNSDGLLLDPGSCSRVFSRLIQKDYARHTPDGMHISFTGKGPRVDRIIEYKAHPEAHPEDTTESIARLTDFANNNSGLLIHFSPKLIIDAAKGIEAKRLVISRSLQTSLVIPKDRNFETPRGVDLVRTPFDSRFLGQVVFSVLSDISTPHDQ